MNTFQENYQKGYCVLFFQSYEPEWVKLYSTKILCLFEYWIPYSIRSNKRLDWDIINVIKICWENDYSQERKLTSMPYHSKQYSSTHGITESAKIMGIFQLSRSELLMMMHQFSELYNNKVLSWSFCDEI